MYFIPYVKLSLMLRLNDWHCLTHLLEVPRGLHNCISLSSECWNILCNSPLSVITLALLSDQVKVYIKFAKNGLMHRNGEGGIKERSN